ncbi:MAG: hypothetical protein ACI9S8_003270 [Chlamydiales bacterium]|jgi:hypothetical protein
MNIWKPILVASLCLTQGLQNAYAAPTSTGNAITETAMPHLRGALRDLGTLTDTNNLAESSSESIDLQARNLGQRDDDEENSNNENSKLDRIANILQSIFDRLEILSNINTGIGHVKDESWEIHQLMNQLVADGE